MRELVNQGKSIIFITHKLREILDVSDRIMVVRRGKIVGETTPQEADQNKLASMMVGREVQLDLEKMPAKLGETVLNVTDLTVTDDQKQITVDEVSLNVKSGEILG